MTETRKKETPFTPELLATFSIPELIVLQYELRTFPEDRHHLDAVLQEVRRRALDQSPSPKETPNEC